MKTEHAFSKEFLCVKENNWIFTLEQGLSISSNVKNGNAKSTLNFLYRSVSVLLGVGLFLHNL